MNNDMEYNKILSWNPGKILHRLWNRIHHKVRVYSFPIFCVYGISGVLIDLDHVIGKEIQISRPLHLPYLIIVGIICISYHTYHHRRFHNVSIRRQ